MDSSSAAPRVFVSYSWTSSEHVEWVLELGKRLRSDEIDVVLDRWDLKEGQDAIDFMEQMVKDPSMARVLVVCDQVYRDKADERRVSGVGTETQIISKHVYDQVKQEKFIPLVREKDDDGKPCLPIFFPKSNLHRFFK